MVFRQRNWSKPHYLWSEFIALTFPAYRVSQIGVLDNTASQYVNRI